MPFTFTQSFNPRLLLLALAVSACLGFAASAAEPAGAIIRTPEKIHHIRNDIGGTVGNESAPGLNAAAPPAKLGYAFFHEFCLALKVAPGKETPVAYRFEGPDPFDRGELRADRIRYAITRAGDETNYEIAIPWKELDTQLSGPPAEKELGFGIVVNDVDIEKGFKANRKAMGAFGVMGPAPSFGVLTLEWTDLSLATTKPRLEQ